MWHTLAITNPQTSPDECDPGRILSDGFSRDAQKGLVEALTILGFSCLL